MTALPRLMFAAFATAALAACAPVDQPPPADDRPPVAAKPPVVESPDTDPTMKCDTSTTGWAIGQVADETNVNRIRTETRSKGVRVIKPGMAVTMDYREDRVNIDVDAHNRILKVRCG